MNIFFLEKSVSKSVSCYYNRHVVKIILEITQMLYTVFEPYLKHMYTTLVPFKPTHTKHPMVIWLAQSIDNVHYALDMASALCREYTRRYEKVHRCKKHIKYLQKLSRLESFRDQWTKRVIPDYSCATVLSYLDDSDPAYRELTPIPLCMPERYHGESAMISYRLYYLMDKRRIRTSMECAASDVMSLDRKLFDRWRIK